MTADAAALRVVADSLRVLMALAVPLLLALGRPDAAYAVALVTAATVVLRWARTPAIADLTFMALVSIDVALTAAGAFDSFNRNDTVGHLLLAAAVTPLAFYLARRLHVLPASYGSDAAGRWAAITGAAIVTMALGTGWEIVEWASDSILGTNMSLGYTDTVRDLVADTAGAWIGALIAVVLVAGE